MKQVHQPGAQPAGSERAGAFTLVELMVVIAVIGILAGLLLPTLSRAKQSANRVKCLNHMRQLGVALKIYADENEDEYPARRKSTNSWPFALRRYYVQDEILQCPSDHSSVQRSYVFNGWNDYFEQHLTTAEYQMFTNWSWPHGIRESAINEPSETITFGEKSTDSRHVHMDFYQGNGDDLEQLNHSRHSSSAQGRGGGSNFAFADGSTRFLLYGQSVYPVNLWAVTLEWRQGIKLD